MQPVQQSHSKALGPGVTGPSLAVASAREAEARPAPTGQAMLPSCGSQAFVCDPAALAAGNPRQRTQYPYVTGTSVLAMVYADGVMIACDTLGAYGSTKRYKSLERIYKVNERCVVAAGGEISDFQQIVRYLEELVMGDFTAEDGIELGPREVYAYLCRVMYNRCAPRVPRRAGRGAVLGRGRGATGMHRCTPCTCASVVAACSAQRMHPAPPPPVLRRNKMDPLWNSLIVGGVEEGKPFLGSVGMIGTHYTDTTMATGFGNMLARPLFRCDAACIRAGSTDCDAHVQRAWQQQLLSSSTSRCTRHHQPSRTAPAASAKARPAQPPLSTPQSPADTLASPGCCPPPFTPPVWAGRSTQTT